MNTKKYTYQERYFIIDRNKFIIACVSGFAALCAGGAILVSSFGGEPVRPPVFTSYIIMFGCNAIVSALNLDLSVQFKKKRVYENEETEDEKLRKRLLKG